MYKREAGADLPVLRMYAKQIHDLAESGLRNPIEFSGDDHLAFMALCFSYKQLEHSRSLKLLTDHDLYVDAETVCRTMLEGLVLLAWASLKPHARPLNWRSYSLVSDWREIIAQETAGIGFDAEEKRLLKERLKEHCDIFLTKAARSKGDACFPDPYQRTWCLNEKGAKVEISEMVDELGDKTLKMLYDDLSQGMHWTTRGVGKNLYRYDGRVGVSFGSADMAASVCAVWIFSLAQTLQVLASHLSMDLYGQLQDVLDQYKKDLDAIQTLPQLMVRQN